MPGVELFEREALNTLVELQPTLLFSNPVEFSEYVEMIAAKQESTITTVLLNYYEMFDVEYEDLSKLLTASIKGKIMLELQDLGLMQKETQLQFE